MIEVASAGTASSRQQTVLLVKFDRKTALDIQAALASVQLQTVAATSERQMLDALRDTMRPGLAVVDINGSSEPGLETCRLVSEVAHIPVIAVSATGDERTVMRFLNECADDFIVKPIRLGELVARVRRLLRQQARLRDAHATSLQVDARLTIDFGGQQAFVNGIATPLTPTEAKLLSSLIRRGGRTVLIETLLRQLWPMEEASEDTLRFHVYRLRQKIEPIPSQPRYVLTVRGVGYRFIEPNSNAE